MKATFIRSLAIVLILMLGDAAQAAGSALKIAVSLEIEQHGFDIEAKLNFVNRTSINIPLLKSESGLEFGVIDDNVFEVKDVYGNFLPLRQRGIANIEADSIIIPPGAMIETKILLNHFYLLTKDNAPYSIKYVASRMCDRCGEFNSVDYVSNEVSFTFR